VGSGSIFGVALALKLAAGSKDIHATRRLQPLAPM
jgi:hypothetical protein